MSREAKLHIRPLAILSEDLVQILKRSSMLTRGTIRRFCMPMIKSRKKQLCAEEYGVIEMLWKTENSDPIECFAINCGFKEITKLFKRRRGRNRCKMPTTYACRNSGELIKDTLCKTDAGRVIVRMIKATKNTEKQTGNASALGLIPDSKKMSVRNRSRRHMTWGKGRS